MTADDIHKILPASFNFEHKQNVSHQ